jgi:hypothetical protein
VPKQGQMKGREMEYNQGGMGLTLRGTETAAKVFL